ncbi:hypothetical protein L249_7683 [Ophiocordyceps polyrhachis-furcata BCC 54312]|uniref:Uncharacterized protein n=1 Tax=Ophiocordyceps polyrhachis-furcata BCC 54312 TaxID=1330021 RepID=A0A367LAG4_9HYPO|nr:hypothetical protein L249_7683 [Ophiocordyceps polyrhachis-furcata BCC 54312]
MSQRAVAARLLWLTPRLRFASSFLHPYLLQWLFFPRRDEKKKKVPLMQTPPITSSTLLSRISKPEDQATQMPGCKQPKTAPRTARITDASPRKPAITTLTRRIAPLLNKRLRSCHASEQGDEKDGELHHGKALLTWKLLNNLGLKLARKNTPLLIQAHISCHQTSYARMTIVNYQKTRAYLSVYRNLHTYRLRTASTSVRICMSQPSIIDLCLKSQAKLIRSFHPPFTRLQLKKKKKDEI